MFTARVCFSTSRRAPGLNTSQSGPTPARPRDPPAHPQPPHCTGSPCTVASSLLLVSLSALTSDRLFVQEALSSLGDLLCFSKDVVSANLGFLVNQKHASASRLGKCCFFFRRTGKMDVWIGGLREQLCGQFHYPDRGGGGKKKTNRRRYLLSCCKAANTSRSNMIQFLAELWARWLRTPGATDAQARGRQKGEPGSETELEIERAVGIHATLGRAS